MYNCEYFKNIHLGMSNFCNLILYSRISMSKNYDCILIVFTLLLSSFSNAQNTNPSTAMNFANKTITLLTALEKKQIDAVYGQFTHQEIYSREYRVAFIKELLSERIEIKQVTTHPKKQAMIKLSEVPLFDVFNKKLKRDRRFNPKNFNSLKYRLNFYSKSYQTYHVDDTDYYIIIKPQ